MKMGSWKLGFGIDLIVMINIRHINTLFMCLNHGFIVRIIMLCSLESNKMCIIKLFIHHQMLFTNRLIYSNKTIYKLIHTLFIKYANLSYP